MIEPENILHFNGERLQKINSSGEVLANFVQIKFQSHHESISKKLTPLSSRIPGHSIWVVFTSWLNQTGNPIKYFSTEWKVPSPPITHSGQLIYLFNGIQNADMILQPVLQWGDNGSFGGDYWGVASWYADGEDGDAYHSEFVPIDTYVNGIMELKRPGTLPNHYDYECSFYGISETSLKIQNQTELTWCCETLETYDITKCSDYPNTVSTSFQNIDIQTSKGSLAFNWNINNNVVNYGQEAVAFYNKNYPAEVEIYYRGLKATTSFSVMIFGITEAIT